MMLCQVVLPARKWSLRGPEGYFWSNPEVVPAREVTMTGGGVSSVDVRVSFELGNGEFLASRASY